MPLPINLEDLLSAQSVESNRIEFKKGWNPDAIYRSICAFANDLGDLGGGYIVVGVEEASGIAKRPVAGLKANEIADIQKKMIGFNNLLRPAYHPKLFIETVDNNQIIVLWIPGGSSRPYEVPEEVTAKEKKFAYYIRQYANSIKPNLAQTQELINLANRIPFDDRPNIASTIADLDEALIREHLRLTGSQLIEWVGQRTIEELLDQMSLIEGPMEKRFPKNVALMLFSENPDQFFPYTYIDLVHFQKGPADKQFIEKQFKGPVQRQITQVLDYLNTNVLHQMVIKVEGKAEAERVWNYPFQALEEIMANVIFHRSYEIREPVKVRIELNRMIIYNSGGPDRFIKMEDFKSGHVFPKRYRNRRLGDFLKELHLTEGHATGIPVIIEAMKRNGSPEPLFETDEDRSWFQVILPMHEAFLGTPTSEIDPVHTDDSFTSALSSLVSSLVSNLVSSEEIYLDMARVLQFMGDGPQKREDILSHIGLSNQTYNYRHYIEPLEKAELIEKTIPDKPQSPKQRYILSQKGKDLIHSIIDATSGQ